MRDIVDLSLPPEAIRNQTRFQAIVEIVCQEFEMSSNLLLGGNRQRKFVRARWALWYIAREFTRYSLPHLGRLTGGRDHTSVLHGVTSLPEYLIREFDFDVRFSKAFVRAEERFANHWPIKLEAAE